MLSPVLWWKNNQMLADLDANNANAWLKSMQFWVDIGTAEGARPGGRSPELAQTRRLASRLAAAGLHSGRDYMYVEVQGGIHSELAWRQRFGQVLGFFFPGPAALQETAAPALTFRLPSAEPDPKPVAIPDIRDGR
jgi:hypothetical protein